MQGRKANKLIKSRGLTHGQNAKQGRNRPGIHSI